MAEITEFDQMFYTNFEPKMTNRFIMEVEGIPSFLIKSMGRPTISTETVTIDHINVQRKIKGKTTWGDISITLHDPIVPSGAQAVMEWVRLSHESITGREGYADFYKKDCTFYMLGPVGDRVEQWTIKGAFITEASFGDLNYESTEKAEISVTLAYDFAILEY